jgi:phytoene desaturase
MARAGWDVTVIEKHKTPGGRARQFQSDGFTFDMGPSWYWMPEVFERYFNRFGKNVSDYYRLQRLDPSYRVYFKDGPVDIPADLQSLQELFDSIEPGSGARLEAFLAEAAYKYKVGMQKLVFKPGRSLTEFIDADLFKGLFRLDVFRSMRAHVAKYFRHPKLVELLEFPVLVSWCAS